MTEASLDEIKETALRLNHAGQPWHFHMLVPGCSLNEGRDHCFVLEDIGGGRVYAHHSDKPEKELGQALLPLLHGKKVLEKAESDGVHQPNDVVKKIVERARELNEQGVSWHHHVLFPQCKFNAHAGKWTLMFEDAQNHEVLESQTDQEPVKDLKLVEPLFYARKL